MLLDYPPIRIVTYLAIKVAYRIILFFLFPLQIFIFNALY